MSKKPKSGKGERRKAKSEVLWLGFDRRHGTCLPWIWGITRASCMDRWGVWKPRDFVRRRVRIVPLNPKRKAK